MLQRLSIFNRGFLLLQQSHFVLYRGIGEDLCAVRTVAIFSFPVSVRGKKILGPHPGHSEFDLQGSSFYSIFLI